MSSATTKDLHIHLKADKYVRDGVIHLLASFSDYVQLQEFFSSHFNTFSYTHDEIGFPDQLFECPKGSMFVRDETGELVRKK
jgi:hypothetical protein